MNMTDIKSISGLKQNVFYCLCLVSILGTPAQAQQKSWHEEPAQYCKLNKSYKCVNIDVSRSDTICVDEGPDYCYDITPPPKNAIRLDRDRGSRTPYSLVRPEYWPFRAVYMNSLGVVEFDEKGNIVNAGRKNWNWNSAYVAEKYHITENHALWRNKRYKLYYLVVPDTQSPENSSTALTFVVSRDFKHFCPVFEIAVDYSIIKNNERYIYLRGDCDQARTVEIKGHTYLAYPGDAITGWVMQRFEDPKEPIYGYHYDDDSYSGSDDEGKCLLYCAPK